jgi:hypothetical protein
MAFWDQMAQARQLQFVSSWVYFGRASGRVLLAGREVKAGAAYQELHGVGTLVEDSRQSGSWRLLQVTVPAHPAIAVHILR